MNSVLGDVSTGSGGVDLTLLTGREVKIGLQAGINTQGAWGVAIGNKAGENTQGVSALSIGEMAGRNNQKTHAIAIGVSAGSTTQGAHAIAIGTYAGKTSQAPNSIVLNATGFTDLNNTVENSLVIKPVRATDVNSHILTYNDTTGEISKSTIAQVQTSILTNPTLTGNVSLPITTTYNGQNLGTLIGSGGGGGTGTLPYLLNNITSVAVGTNAGTTQGDASVAIGVEAGTNQTGYSVALGYQAGKTNQKIATVAVGDMAGMNTQSAGGVAVGSSAGQNTQGPNAVALGYTAGNSSQGENAIAIGNKAGLNNQAPNSIILNASGVELNTSVSGFIVKPVRATDVNSHILTYNDTTGEISKSTIAQVQANLLADLIARVEALEGGAPPSTTQEASKVSPKFTDLTTIETNVDWPDAGWRVSSGTTISSGFPAWKAFDKTTAGGNAWLCEQNEFSGSTGLPTGSDGGVWLRIDFPSTYMMDSFSIYTESLATPLDWELQGSNDLFSSFTVVQFYSKSAWSVATTYNFTVTNTHIAFQNWRLFFRKKVTTTTETFISIGELSFTTKAKL